MGRLRESAFLPSRFTEAAYNSNKQIFLIEEFGREVEHDL